jgi:hypothetical protein
MGRRLPEMWVTPMLYKTFANQYVMGIDVKLEKRDAERKMTNLLEPKLV